MLGFERLDFSVPEVEKKTRNRASYYSFFSTSGAGKAIDQNAWFYAPLFFVLLSFKKRVMAHSLAIFLKYRRAEKK